MCGIISGTNVALDMQQKALSKLSARGPDHQQIIQLNNIFIGHTLLSIFSEDAIGSTQPIWSEDRTIVGCVNGEIYNYSELRTLLESHGYKFSLKTDSEVIIHGIHLMGHKFIPLIDGEFCFVTYNLRTENWLCAVDRFGTKPLRYYLDKDSFYIGSSIAALKPLIGNLSMSVDNILFSLASQCIPSGKTLFENIYSINPGHYLLIDKDLSTKNVCYVSANKDNNLFDLNKIEYLLEQAIIKRVPKSKKFSLALSSGIDSSLIAYYLQKNKIDFDIFSIDFLDSEFSERNDITLFLSDHNMSSSFIDISEYNLISNFPKVTLNSENLSINPHAVGKYIINKTMLDSGHKVCFTGDGSDELFFGYSHFHTRDPYQFITDSGNLSKGYNDIINFNITLDTKYILSESQGTAQQLYYKYWLNEYGLKLLGDSQSASIGQEHRYPFLDYKLHDYIASIDNFCELNYPSKTVLRNIVGRWNRRLALVPKRPFTSHRISNKWIPLFEEYVFENNKLHNLGIFDRNKVVEYVYRLSTEHMPNRIVLAQLLSLGILLKDM